MPFKLIIGGKDREESSFASEALKLTTIGEIPASQAEKVEELERILELLNTKNLEVMNASLRSRLHLRFMAVLNGLSPEIKRLWKEKEQKELRKISHASDREQTLAEVGLGMAVVPAITFIISTSVHVVLRWANFEELDIDIATKMLFIMLSSSMVGGNIGEKLMRRRHRMSVEDIEPLPFYEKILPVIMELSVMRQLLFENKENFEENFALYEHGCHDFFASLNDEEREMYMAYLKKLYDFLYHPIRKNRKISIAKFNQYHEEYDRLLYGLPSDVRTEFVQKNFTENNRWIPALEWETSKVKMGIGGIVGSIGSLWNPVASATSFMAGVVLVAKRMRSLRGIERARQRDKEFIDRLLEQSK